MTLLGGRSGSSWLKADEEKATRRPVPVKTIASSISLAARSEVISRAVSASLAVFSRRAMLRARLLSSAIWASRAARPRFRPASSAVSTRTLNQDSIERDMNCTDST